MKLKNKNILLISPEPWDHIFVSKHHYATLLADRGNKVFFLNPPSKQELVENTDFENVFSVSYNGFIKGLRFAPSVLQRYFINKKFSKLQNLCKVKFDVVWSFDNSVFFDFTALSKSAFCISHIVDWNQDFKFKKATKTADLCLTTTSFIVEKQRKYNSNSYNIGHGLNQVNGRLQYFELQGSNRINCGYAGNLDIKYIDWDLVDKLLKKFPEVDFHFAGQWKSKVNFYQICQNSNFHFYGQLPSDLLPSFYKKMDLLLLVYQYDKYPEQLANPHKMMEYLASGKMIMATWTTEYEELHKKGFLKMTKTAMDFISEFEEIHNNLIEWNTKSLLSARMDFAYNYSYQNQICKIENLIYSD